MAKKILVLGSSNVDFILRIPRFHNPGETILAENLITAFGGKGANQAIAAKRLGGKVSFITKLGNDPYGKSYLEYLIKSGLNRKCLIMDRNQPNGMALIELNPKPLPVSGSSLTLDLQPYQIRTIKLGIKSK